MRLARADDCRDEAALLLPWFINGRLGAEDMRRVESHLEGCAVCRDDAAQLETVEAVLRTPATVEYAPRAGLRKLMARVDQEKAAGDVVTARTVAAVPPAAAPRPRPTWRSPVRWMAAAVVAQACGIAALVAALLLGPASVDGPAPFRTLTSPTRSDGPRVRVVFAPTMTLAEVQEVLRANQLVAVAGPSAGGVFTLALQAPQANDEARAAAIARLRADARVRFAEAVDGEPGGR